MINYLDNRAGVMTDDTLAMRVLPKADQRLLICFGEWCWKR